MRAAAMGYPLKFSEGSETQGEHPVAHPLIDQLRFARSEFLRALDGLSDDDARRRLGPMNCISWNVGHLAWQEQRYWLQRGQGRTPRPDVQATFAYGAPGTTPAPRCGAA